MCKIRSLVLEGKALKRYERWRKIEGGIGNIDDFNYN